MGVCNSLGAQSHPQASHTGFIDGQRANSETHGRQLPVLHPRVSLNFRFLFVWLVVVVTKYPRKQVTGIKIGFDSWLQSSHARAP